MGADLVREQTTNLIEEKVRAPGGASSQNVGRDSSIETSQPLRPHYGGHRVPDVGVSSTSSPTIVHSKPREMISRLLAPPPAPAVSDRIFSKSRGWRRRVETTPPEMPATMWRSWTVPM